MKLELKRRFLGESYTIGSLSIDGKKFCDTLEDKVRDLNKNGVFDGDEKKVYAETAITFFPSRSKTPFLRELPRLQNVKHFEGILIHRGNTAEDSAGCILVGENKVKGKVINSTPYERELVRILKEAQGRKEPITIKIV